ncbi:MAG: cation-translocating P-type ATPase [Deltaproteobacteria bacterium]|nr:cation-translocating P-type ATPase [Deltaproteobacteria bacterium]
MKQANTGLAQPWHTLSAEETARRLGSDLHRGLSFGEAAQRLAESGRNELQEAPRPPFWSLLLCQFKNLVVTMLILASLISCFLGDYLGATVIMAIVLLNAIIRVIQESKAEHALAALKKMASPNSTVIREGARVTIPSPELVSGDIVIMEAGNYVPADVRLFDTVNMRIEESALTGESVPVDKQADEILEEKIPLGDRRNTAYMGTLVSYGRGGGIVVATGIRTQMGMIARILGSLEAEPTPLQQRLDQLGKQLGYAAMVICALVFIVAVLHQTNLGLITGPDGGLFVYFRKFSSVLSELFFIAVSLAIAAVPEGLPAIVTITLAMGMREMLGRHALIRRLAAVETLGSVTVICSDKTGTLTPNQMTAVRLWTDDHLFVISGEGYKPGGGFCLDGQPIDIAKHPGALSTLWAGALSADAYLEFSGEKDSTSFRIVGDPTEGAIIVAAAKAGARKAELDSLYPRLFEIPFDSARKCMSTIHTIANPDNTACALPFIRDAVQTQSLYITVCKGAPDVIIGLCARYLHVTGESVALTDDRRERIVNANKLMARRALRVIAVSYRISDTQPDMESPVEVESNLVFLGLIGLIDPPRPEVPSAIAIARQAGIRTVMITGDYPDTAASIGRDIGLTQKDEQVLTGQDIDRLDTPALLDALAGTAIFARINPEHKVRIVDGLKQRGEVVAMTGDGVNDAPALKRADIGIAMGITGSDVAREAADMVLTDDNYVSIVAAVEQGRVIYTNIRSFIFFLLSSNLAEIMIIFLPTLFALPCPLTAIQILWLNLITDGAPALALAKEKGDPDVMRHPPRPKMEPIIHGSMRTGILVQTVAQSGVTLTAFLLGLFWHLQSTGAIPPGANPLFLLFKYNWSGVEVTTAKTMAFVTLSMCELFRAFTVRSDRISIFQRGHLLSNPYMVGAVLVSALLMMVTVAVPWLNPVFNTHPLGFMECGVVAGLALIPAVTEEMTKWYQRVTVSST